MTFLVRPRYVGFGDGDAASGAFDPGDPAGNPAGGIDWGSMDLTLPTFPASVAAPVDLSTVANDIVKGARTWYGAQTEVNNASAASELAKARNAAAINIAKAGGSNAALTAKAGLPSPTLLLAAGVALGAVLLLRR